MLTIANIVSRYWFYTGIFFCAEELLPCDS